MFSQQNWYPLQSSKLQVKSEYTETCPLAYWCPAILSFQTGMDATLHAKALVTQNSTSKSRTKSYENLVDVVESGNSW